MVVEPSNPNPGSDTGKIDESKLFAPEAIVSDMPTQEEITREIEGTSPVVVPEGGDKTQVSQVVTDFDKLPDGYAWQNLKEELGEEYNVPEEILTGKKKDGTELSKKERYDILVHEIQANSEPDQPGFNTNDPFLARYQVASLQKDFNPVDFMRQEAETINYLNMPAREYYEAVLKSEIDETTKQRKYTDEAIKAHLDGMNPIQIEEKVGVMKQNYVAYLKQRDAELIKSIHGNVTSKFDTDEAENQKYITSYIDQNKSNRNFLGIELSEADHVEFLKELPEYIKRDKQTGHNRFEKDMLSNEAFSELMPLLWLRSKGKLKTYLSLIKEQTKEKIEGKLGDGQQNLSGNSGAGDAIDKAKLYSRS